jgi:hypothetical protein
MSLSRLNFSFFFVLAWRPATVTSSLKTRKLNALRVPTCRYQLSCPTRDTCLPFRLFIDHKGNGRGGFPDGQHEVMCQSVFQTFLVR